MRIAIDARMIKSGSMHGIARYVFELLKELKNIDPSHSYYILIHADSPLRHIESWPDTFHWVEIQSEWISFWEQIEIPRVLRKLKVDLFHAPSFVAPLFTPCKLIMTIHDLNHLVLPQFYTPFHQVYYKLFVRGCIRRSSFILTVSQFSKDEIVKTLKLPESKIFVTYNGVSDSYRHIEDKNFVEYVREIYELPEHFIFCVSNNKPHKNVQQLVRAYCYSDINIPLVLACPVDRNLIRISESFGKKHLLYFTRFIEEKHLPAVYSLTDLFVYPSTYEGFGLPPLEAIACGSKVVVARASSLPEVVGDVATFANPFDYQDIANALTSSLASSTTLEERKKLGSQHARQFSWKLMAQRTLGIYEKALLTDELIQEIQALPSEQK